MPKYLDMHGLETLTGEIEATYLRKNKRGAANGVASLDSNGKVPVSQIPGGAGGTTDYDDLTDKPQINGTTLSGNKTSANLGIHDIPSGGTTGQVLAKSSDSNYAVQWVNQQGGGGGTTDYADLDNKPQINGTTLSGNKTTANLGIHDVPSGGSTGQVLAKHSGTDHDVEWVTPAEPASTDEIVVVSDTTPTDPDARIWFPETQPQGIEIPTYPEFQEVAQDVSELKTEINSIGDLATGIEYGGKILSTNVKNALLDLFAHVTYTDGNAQQYIQALKSAWGVTGTLSGITAVFTQGSAVITENDDLDALEEYLVVNGIYTVGDYSFENEVTEYTLSGTLTEGESTITVTYNGKTTTFTVIVTSTLPSEYQEVTYLEATGTQYINTGVDLSNEKNIYIEVDFEMLANASSDNGILCGETAVSAYGAWKLPNWCSKALEVRGYGISNNNAYTLEKGERAKIVFDYSDGSQKILVDGNTVVTDTKQWQSGSNKALIMFGAHGNNGTIQWKAKARVYNVFIRFGSTEIRNFIPCYRRSDNEPGMYDTANGVFYTNDGTGIFNIGSEVNPPVPAGNIVQCVQSGNPLMFATNVAKKTNISVPTAQSGTSAIVYATGANIWDEKVELKTINPDGSISTGGSVCNKNLIPVVAGETYVMVWPRGIGNGIAAYYDENLDLVEYKSEFPDEQKGATVSYGKFTVPADACYLKFGMNGNYGSTYNYNVSINFPHTDHEYHRYSGMVHSVTVPTEEILSGLGTNVLQNNLNKDMTAEFSCSNPIEDTLTVMTYNLQYFRNLNGDCEMQEEIFDEYGASVVGLQELRVNHNVTDAESAVLHPRYWNIYMGMYDNLPNAIATNYGLSNVQSHPFVNQYENENKEYVTAEMQFKGKTVFLISTHLTAADDAVKVLQIAELFALVQTKESFILMGDLNTSTCISTYSPQYINMIKQFVDAGYNVANCSEQFGFKYTWYNSSTIETVQKEPDDNIITSADFTMSNVRTDTIKIAEAEAQDEIIDHVALICDLTLSTNT